MARVASQKEKEVIGKVSIPNYMYTIVVPNMGGYYDGDYPVDFDVDLRAKCPLHDENTPSFRYYPDTNSYYCWGCASGGNVINLHMNFMEKLNGKGITREEAVDFLYNYFVVGKNMTDFIDNSDRVISEESKSEADEIIRFEQYIDNLNKSIIRDTKLVSKIKYRVYSEIDKVKNLVDKNLLNATDAREYMINFIKEYLMKNTVN